MYHDVSQFVCLFLYIALITSDVISFVPIICWNCYWMSCWTETGSCINAGSFWDNILPWVDETDPLLECCEDFGAMSAEFRWWCLTDCSSNVRVLASAFLCCTVRSMQRALLELNSSKREGSCPTCQSAGKEAESTEESDFSAPCKRSVIIFRAASCQRKNGSFGSILGYWWVHMTTLYFQKNMTTLMHG